MTCPCSRANDAHRRYCGGCGVRVGCACARCQFVNALDDRFCGGCGDALVAAAAAMSSASPAKPARAAAPSARAGDSMSAAELASLLGTSSSKAPVVLPQVVSQDDLDRLFGGVS